jgi:hypothetical protein
MDYHLVTKSSLLTASPADATTTGPMTLHQYKNCLISDFAVNGEHAVSLVGLYGLALVDDTAPKHSLYISLSINSCKFSSADDECYFDEIDLNAESKYAIRHICQTSSNTVMASTMDTHHKVIN